MTKIIENLGLEYKDCKEIPLCELPLIDQYWRPKKVQIMGASCGDLMVKQRSNENRTYDLFVISDIPKDEEDKTGLPFTGKVGEKVQELIRKSGINLDNTYLTYQTKCKTPKNRKASGSESKACLTHLYYEIRKYQPKIILIIGSNPLSLFNLNRFGGIGNTRGKVFERKLPHWIDGPTFKVVATYNPGQFLYTPNAGQEAQMETDFLLVKSLLDGNAPTKFKYDIKYEIVKTKEQVQSMKEQIFMKGAFAFDTESPGFNFLKMPCMTFQCSIGIGKTWVIPFYSHDPEGHPFKLKANFNNELYNEMKIVIQSLFSSPRIAKIAHNIKYDLQVCRSWFGARPQGRLWDTQLMHHLLYEYPPHDLKYLAETEFKVGDYEEDIRAIVGEGKNRDSYDNIPDEILWPYAAIDAESTWRLWEEKLYPQLNAKPNLILLYEEETEPIISIFADAEWDGIKVNLDNIKKLEKFYQDELEKIKSQCRAITTPDFNPASTKDVIEALKALGFESEIYDQTKSSKYTANKDRLNEVDHPLAELIIKFRNYNKMLTTYVENIINDMDENQRVRYAFRIDGTTSGRQSCKVLHQIPKTDVSKIEKGEGAMREIFTEEDDYYIVSADYSQMELYIFAYKTGEKDLIEALEDPNGDVHAVTAAGALQITKEQVSKVNRRNVGKGLNFGSLYGSEGYKLAKVEYENPFTGKMEKIGKRAFEFVKNFMEKYPKAKQFLTETPIKALANNCIVMNDFGRERRLYTLKDKDEGVRKHAEREATNFMIQGPASSVQTRTIILMEKALKQHNVGRNKVRFLMAVHDAAIYGVHKDYWPWFRQTYATIAQRPLAFLGGKSLPIEIGAGKNWMEAEDNSEKV